MKYDLGQFLWDSFIYTFRVYLRGNPDPLARTAGAGSGGARSLWRSGESRRTGGGQEERLTQRKLDGNQVRVSPRQKRLHLPLWGQAVINDCQETNVSHIRRHSSLSYSQHSPVAGMTFLSSRGPLFCCYGKKTTFFYFYFTLTFSLTAVSILSAFSRTLCWLNEQKKRWSWSESASFCLTVPEIK